MWHLTAFRTFLFSGDLVLGLTNETHLPRISGRIGNISYSFVLPSNDAAQREDIYPEMWRDGDCDFTTFTVSAGTGNAECRRCEEMV